MSATFKTGVPTDVVYAEQLIAKANSLTAQLSSTIRELVTITKKLDDSVRAFRQEELPLADPVVRIEEGSEWRLRKGSAEDRRRKVIVRYSSDGAVGYRYEKPKKGNTFVSSCNILREKFLKKFVPWSVVR